MRRDQSVSGIIVSASSESISSPGRRGSNTYNFNEFRVSNNVGAMIEFPCNIIKYTGRVGLDVSISQGHVGQRCADSTPYINPLMSPQLLTSN